MSHGTRLVWLGSVSWCVACTGVENTRPGCGGSHSCGGDVVGLWQVDEICPDPVAAAGLVGGQLPDACRDAVESVQVPAFDLSLEYAAAARTVSGNAQVQATLRLSHECLAAQAQFDV